MGHPNNDILVNPAVKLCKNSITYALVMALYLSWPARQDKAEAILVKIDNNGSSNLFGLQNWENSTKIV